MAALTVDGFDHRVGVVEALVGVGAAQAQNDVLHPSWDCPIARLLKAHVSHGGEASAQELVRHDAEAIEVGALIGVAEAQPLGRNVGRCAIPALHESTRQAKVYELGYAIAPHQHVWGLEIQMQNAEVMNIRKGATNLYHEANDV